MRSLVLLLLAVALVAPATAAAGRDEFVGHHRQILRVVAVRGLSLDNLPSLARRGAVGLMVPSAGPKTSASLAFAGIVRGVLHNARLGPKPTGPVLIRVEHADAVPASGHELVIGLPPQKTIRNDSRYPIALLGGCRGILDSALTRVPGVVSAADVARTALETRNRLRCRPDSHAAATLRTLESRIEVARGSTMAATVLLLALLLAFALLAPAGAPAALAGAAAANLGLGLVPSGSVAARLTIFSLCIVGGGLAGRALPRRQSAFGGLLLGVVGAYAIALAVHPSALSLAPLGPELTARFYGVSNVLETLLLVPILAGTALLARRYGAVAFLGGAALGIATIAENRLGADGGGAVVLGAAFPVLAIAMLRARLRMLLPALALTGAVLLVLVDVDSVVTGPDHLRNAFTNGATGIVAVAAHRVPLAYARVAEQWYVFVPLALLALLLWRAHVWALGRDRRALIAAFATAVGVSLLVNDSPGPVALAALASFFALEPAALRRELVRARAPIAPPESVPIPIAVPSRPE